MMLGSVSLCFFPGGQSEDASLTSRRRPIFKQQESARNDERVAMLGAVRNLIPRVERVIRRVGKLHGDSCESAYFARYAGILPEQQISMKFGAKARTRVSRQKSLLLH
jgi:hypothetical protein